MIKKNRLGKDEEIRKQKMKGGEIGIDFYIQLTALSLPVTTIV